MFFNAANQIRQQLQPQAQSPMASPMPTAAPGQANSGWMTPAPGTMRPGLVGGLQMANNPANLAQMRQRQMAQLLMNRPQMINPNMQPPSPIDGTNGSAA